MASTFNPVVLNFDGNPAPKIRKNTTWEVNLTWKDSTGALVDLSYYTAHMHIRKNSQSITTILDLSTSNSRIFLTAQGNIKLKLSPSATSNVPAGKYQYDLVLTDTSSIDTNGEGMGTFPLFVGEINIDDSITRET